MPAAVVTISGAKINLPSGTEAIGPLTISNPTSGGAVTVLTTASGDNTVTVPASTYVGVVIVPPYGNTTALKLKGAGGDTGIVIHPSNPTLYSFPAGTANFILNAAGSGVAIEMNFF